jgi:hypothetical protein
MSADTAPAAMLGSDPGMATCAKNAQVQTAPAAMPGEEEIALLVAGVMGRDNHSLALHTARAILALFAPILAESRNASRYADEVLKTRADAAEANALKAMWEDRALAAEAALAAEREPFAWIRSWIRDGESDDDMAHVVFFKMNDALKWDMEHPERYRVTPVYTAIRAQS